MSIVDAIAKLFSQVDNCLVAICDESRQAKSLSEQLVMKTEWQVDSDIVNFEKRELLYICGYLAGDASSNNRDSFETS
jgi:hypothetical protein